MKSLFISLQLLFSAFSLSGQLLNGTVYDANTKEPLAYASVSIANSFSGTITNEDGYFELKVEKAQDTVIISYIGYEDQIININQKKSPISVYLSTWEVKLDEVIVRSLSPLEYLKKAIAGHAATISDEAFEARGFFAERSTLENDNSGSYHQIEAVFKSYFPNYRDTSQTTENQLALFREKTEGDFRSMLLDNKKMKKRIAKEKKRDTGKKQEVTDEEMEDEMGIDINGLTGGGPENVLDAAQGFINLPFLQAEYFKKIDFSFGKNAFYKNRELIVIDFQVKRKIENILYSGSIYLDYENLAFVAIDFKEDVKIPFLINTLIKTVVGFKLGAIVRNVTIKNQEMDNFWYPKEIVTSTTLTLIQKSEPEIMKAKQLYNIDEIVKDNPKAISIDNKFNAEKEYIDQVKKIEGLDWNNVNVVKY